MKRRKNMSASCTGLGSCESGVARRNNLLSSADSGFGDRLTTLSTKPLPEHHQYGSRPESQDEPAEWNGVRIHEILAQRESGMCGPRDRQTAPSIVVEPCHQDGVGEFVSPPRQKTGRDKLAQMTACRGQHGPIMPDRPDGTDDHAGPEETDCFL